MSRSRREIHIRAELLILQGLKKLKAEAQQNAAQSSLADASVSVRQADHALGQAVKNWGAYWQQSKLQTDWLAMLQQDVNVRETALENAQDIKKASISKLKHCREIHHRESELEKSIAAEVHQDRRKNASKKDDFLIQLFQMMQAVQS